MNRRFLNLRFVFFRRFHSVFPAVTIKDVLLKSPINKQISVQGWVQAVRKHKDIYFVDLVDRTSFSRLQVLMDTKELKCPSYGSSIKVGGLIKKSQHKGQNLELVADSWSLLGSCGEDYPFLYHQKYSSEYIRHHLHMRPRTRVFSSLLRIRNQASMAVHEFFQEEGFVFVHTPIITKNDCEGAGEVFTIAPKHKHTETNINEESEEEEVGKSASAEISDESYSSPQIDKNHFFGSPAYLTVSGQLHLEATACALTRVYNFGPTFRAESSRSRHHASEFQMVEAEIAFIDTPQQLCKVVDKCLKKIACSILQRTEDDFKFLCQSLKNHEEYVKKFIAEPFVQMSYDEVINILQHASAIKMPIKYGEDFNNEHKKFIVQHVGNFPVFVHTFPASIKPFYMKTIDVDKAACFDLFAPTSGEICGGSIREDDGEKLKKKFSFEENDELQWYLDLRKFGTVPHGGFGIGFDRLIQTLLGISNIRDVIPFPRRKYDCNC